MELCQDVKTISQDFEKDCVGTCIPGFCVRLCLCAGWKFATGGEDGVMVRVVWGVLQASMMTDYAERCRAIFVCSIGFLCTIALFVFRCCIVCSSS